MGCFSRQSGLNLSSISDILPIMPSILCMAAVCSCSRCVLLTSPALVSCSTQPTIHRVSPQTYLPNPTCMAGKPTFIRFRCTLSAKGSQPMRLRIASYFCWYQVRLAGQKSCSKGTHLQAESQSGLRRGWKLLSALTTQTWQVTMTLLDLLFWQQKLPGSPPRYTHSVPTSSPISSCNSLWHAWRSVSPGSACPPGNTTLCTCVGVAGVARTLGHQHLGAVPLAALGQHFLGGAGGGTRGGSEDQAYAGLVHVGAGVVVGAGAGVKQELLDEGCEQGLPSSHSENYRQQQYRGQVHIIQITAEMAESLTPQLGILGRNVSKPMPEPFIDARKQNQSLIQQMMKQKNSEVRFAGGYRSPSQAQPGSAAKKPLYRPTQQQVNVQVGRSNPSMNYYQELKVGKSQPKYRLTDQNQSVPADSSYGRADLQSKVQLLRKDRQERSELLFKPGDNYTIADHKQRYQNVTHAKSSLDVISIENIEAKLEAHRRNLKQVEDEYNSKKGKKTPVDRYGLIKVNIDVDKQYAQLQVDQSKVYELVKKRQNLEEDEVEFEELWEMKKKNDPKLAEYDAKYQEYLVSKSAKNMLGSLVKSNLYTWDKYKQSVHEKSKSKVPANKNISVSPQKPANKSLQKENRQADSKSNEKYGPDGLASIKDLGEVIATKDDKFIASYIFARIDASKVGLVSKQELYDYILSQQHIINGYHIDTKWLFTDLDSFETKRKGMLSKSELAVFLATLDKIDHPKLILVNKSDLPLPEAASKQAKKPVSSTFNKNKQIFHKIFSTLDFNDDKIIKRTQLIENIFIDSDCIKILDSQALRIQVIDKKITYRQILGFVLDDYEKEKNEKLKKSKEYITFNRFCQYFDAPESLDLSKIDKKQSKKKKAESIQIQMFDLSEQILLLLKDIFNSIPRIYQDYIVSADFVHNSLRDPQITEQLQQLCRVQSVETKLPLESLQATLHRMQKQCDQYSTWQSIKPFFSRRGRPLDWDFQLIMQKRELRNKSLKEKRGGLSKNKLKEVEKYFQQTETLRNRSKEKISKAVDKYTVPSPFNITDMKQKADVDRAKKGEKQYQQLKKQFKANPVNKQILEPKPELISGKIAKKQKSEKNQYQYENYQNDRIERALKRAQQKQQLQERLRLIKQKAQIKASEIAIDLTKKYKDVVKQNQAKKKQNSKYKPTQPKASESLYPANPKDQKLRKIQQVKENMKKAEEIANRKKKQLEQEQQKARQKNDKAKKLAQQNKKLQQQMEKKRDDIQAQGLDFKPKINKKQLTQKQKQQIERARQARQNKKKQQEQARMMLIQKNKRERLAFEKKKDGINIEGMTDEQIMENLDEIDFQDLLLDDQSKKLYQREFDNSNKSRKDLKQRQRGLAGRERAEMEQQQRRIMQQKRKYKQEVQRKKVNPKGKQSMSVSNAKGQRSAKLSNDMNFHKSRSLMRYRVIMEGKIPESQLDRYSTYKQNEELKVSLKELSEEQNQGESVRQ